MICCKTGAVLLVDVLPKIPILSIPWWWPSWQLHHLGNRFSTIPQRWNSNGLADGGKKQWDRCYKPTQLPPDCFSPFVGWKHEHDDDDDDDESWKFVVANHFWRMTPEISGANIMLVLGMVSGVIPRKLVKLLPSLLNIFSKKGGTNHQLFAKFNSLLARFYMILWSSFFQHFLTIKSKLASVLLPFTDKVCTP